MVTCRVVERAVRRTHVLQCACWHVTRCAGILVSGTKRWRRLTGAVSLCWTMGRCTDALCYNRHPILILVSDELGVRGRPCQWCVER